MKKLALQGWNVVVVVVFLESASAMRTLRLPSDSASDSSREGLNYQLEASSEENYRPLIGILSQPGDGDGGIIVNKRFPNSSKQSNISYVAASYVKFVEAGGARAVPILYNEPENILRQKFASVNGILFPGGSASLDEGPFYQTAELLFNLALAANDNGDYFPVYGVCLGFELLSIFITKNHRILESFEVKNLPGTLKFVHESAKQKSIFKWFPGDLIDKLGDQSLAMENHKWGLSPEKFSENGPLSDFFEILTITPDQKNQNYVSTVQSYKYPVTGVQWHPEKNAFEWGISSIPHGADAIRITQSVANYVISEARKSHHRPTQEEEEKLLVYNYSPVYSGRDGSGFFDQSYVFF